VLFFPLVMLIRPCHDTKMSFDASPDIPDDDRCACGDPFDLHDSRGNKLCTRCASSEDVSAFIDGDAPLTEWTCLCPCGAKRRASP
jgi:hypothetical protein